jgi:hypothetical protein
VSPAGLYDRDRQIFRRPTTNRPRRMRRMHRISKQHSFIGGQLVEQGFIRLGARRSRICLGAPPAGHRELIRDGPPALNICQRPLAAR